MASREPAQRQRRRLNDGFKQRIVGALVLAALAVIFLPSLFDREGARYIDVTSQIPPQPDIQPIEIAEPQPLEDVAPAPSPEEAFQPEVVEHDFAPVAPALESVAESEKSEPVKPSYEQNAEQNSRPVLDAQGLPVAWVVQVASYREERRARALRDKLMDEGYKAYTRAVTTSKGRFVRVFVGPKASRADAETVKRELDSMLKAQTLVLRFKA